MTPLERLHRTIEGKEVDRVPVLVLTKMFGLRQLNIAVDECLRSSPDKYVESQHYCVSELEHEALWAYSGLWEINEILDPTSIKDTADARMVYRPYLESIQNVKTLPEVQVSDQGRIAWVLEIIRRLKRLSENNLPVFGHVSLPFEHAFGLRGNEIYKDIIKAPDLVHRLLEYILELDLQYALLMREAGADIIWGTNPTVNSELLSLRHYDDFGFRYDQRFFSALHHKGIKTMFHACGNWAGRVEKVFQLGADIYYLSRYFDLKESTEICGKAAIMGNVPAVDVLLMGTPEDVWEKSLECISKAAAGGRYILGADCSAPETRLSKTWQ